MKRFLWLLLMAQPLFAVDFNNPQSLVETALASHPTLARMRAEVAAARERVAPAAALPNPMVMAGVQDKKIDLRDDEMMTMYMVGASQTFVRPAKREARRSAAELAAQSLERELDSARAEIERDVLLAWYDLGAADAELRTIEQVRELVDAVVAAARVRYEVGTSAQADVIRAQLQLSDLEHEAVRLRGVDQPIGPFFERYLRGDPDRERKRAITVGDLLTMRSGLERTSGQGYGDWVGSGNWVRSALRKPLLYPPGTQMLYSTGNTHLLSAILSKASKTSTWQFANQSLATPLGFTLARWPQDGSIRSVLVQFRLPMDASPSRRARSG